MEVVSVLRAKVEELWEEREELEKGMARVQGRIENAETRRKEGWGSMEERKKQSEAVAEEERRMTGIRGKISAVDEQTRDLEERLGRVQGKGNGKEEVAEEVERAIEQASRRMEREQKMLEQARSEVLWMRDEM
jgi:predicted  nucleic acid-binding Zn-ribbon protein